MPRATIALLNWNGGEFVRPCVESILKQTEQDIEVVVVDNGSQDGSVDVIEGLLMDSAMRHEIVRLDENRGICGGLQVALDRAAGEYFFPFASDDEMQPDRVQRQCAQFDAAGPGTHVAAGAVALIGPDGAPLRGWTRRALVLKPPRYEGLDQIGKAVRVPPAPGMAFRTTGLRSIGGYDPAAPVEDTDTFKRIILLGGGDVVATPDVVSRYRRHGSNSSRDSNLTRDGLAHTLRTLLDSGVDFGPVSDEWAAYVRVCSEGYTSPWARLLGELSVNPMDRQNVRSAGLEVARSSMSSGRRVRAAAAFVVPSLAGRWVRRLNPR